MKNLNHVIIVMIIFITVFSCKKDEKDKTEDPIKKEAINAKWNVAGANDFKSFEFNLSGNFIVVMAATPASREEIIKFGTYVIVDSKTITLTGFVTITMGTLNENTFNFTIKLDNDPNNVITVNTAKQVEIPSTPRTELLCRTWNLDSIAGMPVAGTEYELTVLFSKAGTYFVESDGEGGLAQWTWKDATEEMLCYSWEGPPICDGSNEVSLPVLTSNKLVIIEWGERYVLSPVVNAKSSEINTSLQNSQIKKGFFRK